MPESSAAEFTTFLREVQPAMIERWERLVAVLSQARHLLADDVSYLMMNNAQEERARWTKLWNPNPPSLLDPALLPALRTVPTLTLSFEFLLPAERQAGRVRRLRRSRDRRRWSRNH
jgi:hypothetical protein